MRYSLAEAFFARDYRLLSPGQHRL